MLKAFAPWGHIRAAINLGNPVLARKDGSVTAGVSVDMAHELGHHLLQRTRGTKATVCRRGDHERRADLQCRRVRKLLLRGAEI